jgi:hypothetical protein
LEEEKAYVDANFDLTQRQRELEKAELDLNYGKQIADEQFAKAQRDSQKIRTQDRARFIAEMQQQQKVEKATLEARFKVAVAGDLINENEQLANQYQELTLRLNNLRAGQDEVTEAQKAELDIAKLTQGMKPEQIALIQAEIDARRQFAAALDTLNPKLEKETRLRALQKELRLAQALTPGLELRERLRQENPTMMAADIEELAGLQEQIARAQKYKEQMVSVAESIGTAFGDAFKNIVSGSMTAQQTLATFFQSVGDYFIDMVGRMIAEWMKAQLIQGFMNIIGAVIPGAGALGSLSSGGFGSFSQSGGFGTGSMSLPGLGGAGALNLGSSVPSYSGMKFANGGLVTGPTLGLVGEGRFNEAIVPLPNGRSIPVELGGAAGNQIVSNITVNVNNGQAQSDAGGGNSSELGRKLEGAVKQIIIGELRPGGVLSGRR